jgi:hypothetical protein
LLLSLAGLFAAIDVIHSQWWQQINNPIDLDKNTITTSRSVPKGFLFI